MCVPAVTRAADDQLGFDATLLYGISYPADTWIPLRLHFRNNSERDYDGSAVIPVERAAGSPTFKLPIRVPARTRVSAVAYVYFPPIEEPARRTKPGEAPASAPVLTIAQWESGGARIARTEIRARSEAPDQIRTLIGGTGGHPESMLLSISESSDESTAYNPMDFSNGLTGITGSWIATTNLQTDTAPNVFAGYVACRAMVLDQTDPDKLDAAQRQALINYLSNGGTLILPCPRGAVADPSNSWLAPYLPVQIIGQRQMNQILPAGADKNAKPFKLTEWLPIVEDIDDGDATVLLRDRDYVHAAYKSIGSGRVIFTSFPINALDMKDPRVQDLWTKLMDLNGRSADWSDSALAGTKQSYLQSMIGLRTPPWSLAAGIAAGYLVLVTVVQFAFPGARRPRGFAVATVVAVVLSATLIIMTALRQQGTDLTGAQLAVLNLSPDGGGMQQAVQAFYGNDQALTLTATSADVTIQPLINGVTHPTVELQPFRVPDAAVHAEKVEQVWMTEGSLPVGTGASAVGRFGPEGLSIEVDNRLNGVIEAPLLIWDAERFSLGNLPTGESTVIANGENRNLRDQYTNVALAISENATARGKILKDLVTPAADDVSMGRQQSARFVAGWLAAGAAPSLLDYSPQTPQLRSQTLARLPLRIEPTPVGTAVKIDGAFMYFPRASAMGLPFDYAKNEWLDSAEGNWLICIAAPREAGQLRTKRVTVEADLEAPQHTIELHRGQVPGGKPRQNLAGPTVAKWTNALGKQTVSFDVEPSDADSNGYVWLLMDAKYTPLAQTGQVMGRWRFRSFSVSYESEVIGGPEKVVMAESNSSREDDD